MPIQHSRRLGYQNLTIYLGNRYESIFYYVNRESYYITFSTLGMIIFYSKTYKLTEVCK